MEKRFNVHKVGVTEEMKEMTVQKQYMKKIRAKVSSPPKLMKYIKEVLQTPSWIRTKEVTID